MQKHAEQTVCLHTVTLNADSGYGTLVLGLNGTATVTQTGGTVTANNGPVFLGRYGSSQGTYTISGGTVQLGLTQPVAGRSFWLDASQPGTLTTDAFALVLNGAGTQILRGTNTYAGGTTINAGTLRVDGSLRGPVAVNGGWLIGDGTIDGPVTVGPAGGLSAGASPGHLVLAADYVQFGTLLVELAGSAQGTQYDWVQVIGAVDFRAGSVLDVNFLSPFVGLPGDRFDVITATGGIQGFERITFDFRHAYTETAWWADIVPVGGGAVALRLTVSPEPASLTLLGLGALALFAKNRRRRRTPSTPPRRRSR